MKFQENKVYSFNDEETNYYVMYYRNGKVATGFWRSGESDVDVTYYSDENWTAYFKYNPDWEDTATISNIDKYKENVEISQRTCIRKLFLGWFDL